MKRWLRKMLLSLVISPVILFLGVGLYVQQPKFGSVPGGLHLEAIQKSPNYVDGQFQNLIATPKFVEDSNSGSVWWNFLFAKKERLAPTDPIPTIKTNLMALDKDQDMVIWLGHSSYFIQLGGKRILIDPVFSDYASPVSFVNKAFKGTNIYSAQDMPEIDYLLISHDHWDHLDYSAVLALKPKIKNVVCGLGVGSYFEQWGFDKKIVHEADWYTSLKMESGMTIHVLPARHFSGRLLSPNKTLWAGFALVTPQRRIFYSGDSGYGPHFKEIGERLDGFDLVLMDNGQHDKRWPYLHMMPEEVAQATEDLKAKALLPGHTGKFAIANHPWDEPFKRITAASQNKNYRLLTPVIGQSIELQNQQPLLSRWWETVQ